MSVEDTVTTAVREQIFAFLLGELDSESFAHAFASSTQPYVGLVAGDADDLISEVRLLLAEYTRGDRSEDELREELRLIAKAAFGVYSGDGSPSTSLHTGSSASVHSLGVVPAGVLVVRT